MSHPANKECHAFAQEICKGDASAITFCDLWYVYCHGIDDLIDTAEDGRPTMNSETTIGLFAQAALLYNCPFYVAHRQHLFPMVLTITNMYCDSVAWEKSPLNRRRVMADVLRCAGDEMLFMVAMICGGWQHMRKISPLIREKDWLGQHDNDDKPH